MSRLFALDHAADTDDWYTPPWIFEGMAETFSLDVCTPPGGVPWIPCEDYFTPDDDGLAVDWYGFVWCNPPYSAPTKWCDKWAKHGDGIIVLRADLSQRGQATAFMAASSIFVPTPRLQFVNGRADAPKQNANFSTILLGAGDRADKALVRLSGRGVYRVLPSDYLTEETE